MRQAAGGAAGGREREAAAEAASLAAAEQVRGVAARDAVRALAASKAREVAAAAAAAAAVATEAAATAEAEANALERAMADGGEGGGSGAAGPSKASEVAAPDQYMCSITAEIMTDPVNTVRLSLPQAIPLVLPAFATPSLRRHTNSLCFYIAPPERKTGRRPYVRAQRYRAVAQDPQHFACDGRRAREQAAHPVPLSPQSHPRLPPGGRVVSAAPWAPPTSPSVRWGPGTHRGAVARRGRRARRGRDRGETGAGRGRSGRGRGRRGRGVLKAHGHVPEESARRTQLRGLGYNV